MSKDNILFSIIGVLLGVIVGYAFATNLNRAGVAPRAPPGDAAAEPAPNSELPENHPPITEGPGSEQAEGSVTDSALIEQALASPDNFDAQMQGAAVQYRNRRFDEAIGLLMNANRLRPDSYEAIVALGNANFDAGRYEIAEKWYTAALVKNPRDINVRNDLGLTFLFREQKNVDRAIQEFRRSLTLDQRHEQSLQNLVVALIKKGRFDEAEATLGKLREVNSTNQSLARLGADLETARSSSGGGKVK